MKIEVEHVTKTFDTARGRFTALEDIDLGISENEIITVVGPSGCGKTTLMNIIAGLESHSRGEVRIDGKAVHGPSPERGVIFQQYALFPWLSVRANVEFGLRYKHVAKRERRRIAQHYIELVGLTAFADALPKELSGGMKQRCGIARAYAVDPTVLLMDEPFGSLDALTKATLQEELLTTWTQEKKTIFFITHDVDEAVFLGHRVLVMSPRPGRIRDLVSIDFEHPRTEELKMSEEFLKYRRRVWDGVHQ